MHFQNTILALFAWGSFALASPAWSWHPAEYTAPPGYRQPPSNSCCIVYNTPTSVESCISTYLSTKTIYIPVTTVSDIQKTTISSYPVTSIETSTKTITTVDTSQITKTYPVTTVIYSTTVENIYNTTTMEETYTCKTVSTSYVTDITICPVIITTSTPTSEICTKTTAVPYSSTIVETQTVCKA